jgi:hypothetical protein
MDAINPASGLDHGRELTVQLDRLTVWPYRNAVIWGGRDQLFYFDFDITDVTFGLPVFAKFSI